MFPREALVPSAIPIPRIVVGSARLGSVLPDFLVSKAARRKVHQHLDSLLELGLSAIDTAASYALGGTERLLGEWMASRRNRGQVFLITKGALPDPLRPHRLKRRAIERDLQASLRRLRVEQIDLYLVHRDDPDASFEPMLEVLTEAQRQGMIRAWGVSNWEWERVRALDARARAWGVPTLAASSPHYSLVEWQRPPWKGTVSIAGARGRAARTFYRDRGIPVLAWAALSQGFFSGAAGDPLHASLHPVYGSPANVARRARAEALGRERGVSAAQIALAYLLNQDLKVYAVVAMDTVEDARRNLEASALRLTDEELHWLETGLDHPSGSRRSTLGEGGLRRGAAWGGAV
jgi:aryl-alcohol dehydrogenase-like predicted oxidoreductase